MQDEYHESPGSVIAADFYHSNVLMGQSDADIVARVQRNVETCEPGFLGAKVLGPMTSKNYTCQAHLIGRSAVTCTLLCPESRQHSVNVYPASPAPAAAMLCAVCATAARQLHSWPEHRAEAESTVPPRRWWTARCCGSPKP